MQITQSLVALLSLSCSVLSAPTPAEFTRPQRQGRSFKVERFLQGSLNGPASLARASRKFGLGNVKLGIDLLGLNLGGGDGNSQDDTQEEDQRGDVTATSVQSDAQFVSPVKIGGQEIVMNFDTGSADFWVMNTNLPQEQVKGHTLFDPSKSKTWKKMDGSTYNITYGDSSYSWGPVGTDTVDIGGAEVTGQSIGLPSEVSSYFTQNTDSNGLVGLGFSSLNTVKPERQKSFFENVADTLDEPVLTARLRSDGVGEYEFGYIDHSKYSGDLVNVTVDPSGGFWQFESKYFTVGDGPLEKITTAPVSIADSGTSLMLVANEVAGTYYSQVEGAVFSQASGGYVYPCKSELPNFSIAIGPSYLATVPGSLINFTGVGKNTTSGEDLCYGGIQSNQDSNIQILGDVFLKALFVVFDMRGPSLGIATPTE